MLPAHEAPMPAALTSPLDKLPPKLQLQHSRHDIWGELVKVQALAHIADAEEAARKEAARRDQLKDALESQLDAVKRAKEAEARISVKEAASLRAMTVEIEREQQHAQRLAAGTVHPPPTHHHHHHHH